MFLLGLGRVSRISCFSFLSDFSCFCFSFWLNVSDVSRCELADVSVDAVLLDEDCGAAVISTGSVCVAASTHDTVTPAVFVILA